MDICFDELLDSVTQARDDHEYHEAITQFARQHPQVKEISAKLYHAGDVFISLVTRQSEQEMRRRLPMLEKEGFTVSPQYCASAVSREGFSVVITRVTGMSTGNPYRYCDGYHLLTQDAKQAAYRDVKTLVQDMGFINPAMLDPNALLITSDPSAHRVFIMDWTGQKFLPLPLYDDEIIDLEDSYTSGVERALEKARKILFSDN